MLKPLGDRILIRPDKVPDTTESGLILVRDTDSLENVGEVVAVGERTSTCCPDCGVTIYVPPSVGVGDVVLYSLHDVMELTVEGERFLLLKEDAISAVIGTAEPEPVGAGDSKHE